MPKGIYIRTKYCVENKPEDVWKRIDKRGEDECWEWVGYRVQGYGHMKIKGKTFKCHRLVYELTYGSIPKGLLVLHHCDNPSCCNPKHLFVGTSKDNSNDMIKKGRSNTSRGEKHYRAILSDKDVLEIRQKYSTGNYSVKELGKEYGVSFKTIENFVYYTRRKNI